MPSGPGAAGRRAPPAPTWPGPGMFISRPIPLHVAGTASMGSRLDPPWSPRRASHGPGGLRRVRALACFLLRGDFAPQRLDPGDDHLGGKADYRALARPLAHGLAKRTTANPRPQP